MDPDDSSFNKSVRFGNMKSVGASLDDYLTFKDAETPADIEGNRRAVAMKFFKALNLCDMNSLAKVIRDDFWELCYISTPDLAEPAVRKCRVMMYFSLLFETYPDGVWKITSQTMSNDTLTASYIFTGTRVFDQSLDSLFQHVSSRAMKQQNYLENAAYCDFVVNNMAEYCRLPKEINFLSCGDENSTALNCNGKPNRFGRIPSSSDVMHSSNSFVASETKSNEAMKSQGNILSLSNPNNINNNSHVISPHAVSITHPSPHPVGNASPRTEFIDEGSLTVSSCVGLIRTKANKALTEGPTRLYRKMDLVFNENNQVIRVIITSTN